MRVVTCGLSSSLSLYDYSENCFQNKEFFTYKKCRKIIKDKLH